MAKARTISCKCDYQKVIKKMTELERILLEKTKERHSQMKICQHSGVTAAPVTVIEFTDCRFRQT